MVRLIPDKARKFTVADGLQERLKLLPLSRRDQLDPPVRQILHPAHDLESRGEAMRGISEPDALHVPLVKYLARGHC